MHRAIEQEPSMNKTVVSTALAVCATAAAFTFVTHLPSAQAQAPGLTQLVPLGAAGQVAWYVDTNKRLVVMCNAFIDNTIECRTKPMP
ncbi:MAG: hypothetical protein AD742_11425 [Methylibium sp. NZG]|nr:MAG: hypothetical protein AD742_11425 [Methylibium sp. NZG]